MPAPFSAFPSRRSPECLPKPCGKTTAAALEGRPAPGLAVHPPGHSEGWHDISGFSYR
jgi:hypothetical protein